MVKLDTNLPATNDHKLHIYLAYKSPNIQLSIIGNTRKILYIQCIKMPSNIFIILVEV